MDYQFLRMAILKNGIDLESFNPYFNGLSILTIPAKELRSKKWGGFNPYFNGLSILTGRRVWT